MSFDDTDESHPIVLPASQLVKVRWERVFCFVLIISPMPPLGSLKLISMMWICSKIQLMVLGLILRPL